MKRYIILLQSVLFTSLGFTQTISEKGGNVGIGIRMPVAKLHIVDQGTSATTTLQLNDRIKFRGDGVLTWGDNADYGILTWDGDKTMLGGQGGKKLSLLAGGIERMLIQTNGNVGIGLGKSSLNAQLVVGSSFGALISGSSGGNGVFGSNLATYQGGSNHNRLYTPYSHNGGYGFSGIQCTWGSIYFHAKNGNTTANQLVNCPRMLIHHSGWVGIGTTKPDNNSLLHVAGKIKAEEIQITVPKTADFVFEKNYQLRPLEEVETFIKDNKHLPEIAPAKEMQKNGVNQSEMNQKLLQKIEELTLYVIDLNKKVEVLQKENSELKKNINQK